MRRASLRPVRLDATAGVALGLALGTAQLDEASLPTWPLRAPCVRLVKK